MSKLIERLFNKTASEAVELLSQRYAAVQKVSYEKRAIDKDTRNALIGAAIGGGGGGLATLGLNYLKGKDLKASDALYGAMAGAIPGGALGYYGGGSIEDLLAGDAAASATATAEAPATPPTTTSPTTTPIKPGASAGNSAGNHTITSGAPAPTITKAPPLLDPFNLGVTLDQANAIESGAAYGTLGTGTAVLANKALNAINPAGVHSSRTQKATKFLTLAGLVAAATGWGANNGYKGTDYISNALKPDPKK
jgi:hypothetical protein